MTDPLPTLIKLHRHRVDEQRRAVAAAEAVLARLLQGLADLRAEMAHERQVSETDEEAGRKWPAYIQYALRREAELGRQVAGAEAQVAAARAELQNRFAEQKKFEIAKEMADADVAAEQARQDRIEMDEIAGMRDARGD